MPRRVQDIIPSKRRSVRDIPLEDSKPSRSSNASTSSSRASKTRSKEDDTEEVKIHKPRVSEKESPKSQEVEEAKEEKPRKQKKKHRFPWMLTTVGVVVVLAGAGFFISSHFATATFTLVPKVVPAKVGGTYVIPPASNGSFGYEIMTITGAASTTVPASVGPYTETKAQGSVTVYNAYSSQAQKLVAGTRLAANSGLAYRLTSSIVVPGYTKSGSTIMPGSVKTSIIADKAGADYNIGGGDVVSDLRFIAYKGTSKYDGFYARLASDISGGFAGSKTVVPPTVLASTTADLQSSLSDDLERRLMAALPEGYVMYPHTSISMFAAPSLAPLASSTSASTRLSVAGTSYGLMFKAVDLARFLAGASSTSAFGTVGYGVPDIDSLSFIMTNQKDFSLSKKSNITARISGAFDLVGAIPVLTIRSAMAGISLSQTQTILKKYAAAIDLSASSAEINPPWVTTVPSDKNNVIIVVKNP
jgi:hypothetical protein